MKAHKWARYTRKQKMLKKIVLDLETHPACAKATADCYYVFKKLDEKSGVAYA